MRLISSANDFVEYIRGLINGLVANDSGKLEHMLGLRDLALLDGHGQRHFMKMNCVESVAD